MACRNHLGKILINLSNPKKLSKKNLRFLCDSNLQTLNQHCHDFEARFCCPKYQKRTREGKQNSTLIAEISQDQTETYENFAKTLPDTVENLRFTLFFPNNKSE